MRRKPQTITSVVQSFDEDVFNFKKVKTSETLIQCQSQLNKSQKLGLMEKFTFVFGTTTFLVNNSPLTKYHSLICPRINESLPQILTKESIEFAIDAITGFNDRSYRIGYNSLGALASVNHLHMHLIHVPEKLYVEDAVSMRKIFRHILLTYGELA